MGQLHLQLYLLAHRVDKLDPLQTKPDLSCEIGTMAIKLLAYPLLQEVLMADLEAARIRAGRSVRSGRFYGRSDRRGNMRFAHWYIPVAISGCRVV